MRNILIILLLFSLNCQAQTPDKQLHLMMGSSFGAWSYVACPKQKGVLPVVFCISGATLIGTAKEIYDSKRGGVFDKKDLAYTVAGGIISAGVITGTKAIIRKIRVKKYKYYRR